jgi:hypothetical protein
VPAEAPLGGTFDRGSFRDPASRVFWQDGRVLRLLSEPGWADWEALASSRLFQEWTAGGRLIETTAEPDPQLRLLSHHKIPFWSYPYEWSFGMLAVAAQLQLDLLTAAIGEGLTLKDATPYNIQFRGVSPVFVDIGSFRPYRPGEPWLGYGQFCRLFLYPLLIQARTGIPFQPLLRGSLDGIRPAEARNLLTGPKVLRPGVLIDVWLQARAERSLGRDPSDIRRELAEAGFSVEMITRNLDRLRKVVAATRWDPPDSTWSDYTGCEHVGSQREAKTAAVSQILAQRRRHLVWDVGANDGYFSKLASPHADLVVAIDADNVVIERLYRSLQGEGPGNVLPLVVNLADPSPALGWRGRERRRLEDRDRPDLVLMLAVIHHLIITHNLPLTEVVDWLTELGSEVLIEWVPPDDPLVRRLMLNRRAEEIHEDYNETAFRSLIDRSFDLAADLPVEGRRLLHLIPRR